MAGPGGKRGFQVDIVPKIVVFLACADPEQAQISRVELCLMTVVMHLNPSLGPSLASAVSSSSLFVFPCVTLLNSCVSFDEFFSLCSGPFLFLSF